MLLMLLDYYLIYYFKNVNIMKTQFFHKCSLASKVIQGHIWPLSCQNHSSTFSFMDRFRWKFVWMLTSWRHNYFKNATFMLWRIFCDFFTLRPSYLIITLTYVLMDIFCPYFILILDPIFLMKWLNIPNDFNSNLLFCKWKQEQKGFTFNV